MMKREIENYQDKVMDSLQLKQIKNSLEQFLIQYSENSKNASIIYDVFATQVKCTPSEKRKLEVLFKLIKKPQKGLFGKLF